MCGRGTQPNAVSTRAAQAARTEQAESAVKGGAGEAGKWARHTAHLRGTTWRCSLPDLTRFAGSHCTGAWPGASVASALMPDDARRALLTRFFDHAPMFPPASLAPSEALVEDRRARESEHAWMLGRLVWPAGQLSEL